MIKIDGSYGEGGGQIVRTAVALSAVTGKPVEIVNIRANRPNPGLRAQHLTTIKCIQEISNADVKGLSVGSKQVTFIPNKIEGDDYKFDIGTAGSITLVFQAALLATFQSDKPFSLRLKGGTDVKWSPSWDYFSQVFLRLVRKMGINVSAELVRRGYYPEGDGEAILRVNPSNDIIPFDVTSRQSFEKVEGIIHISKLPEHISKRMKHAAKKIFVKYGIKDNVKIEKVENAVCEGVGITLWSQSEETILGNTILGEKGLPAENIGETAARNIVNEITSGATLDTYAADQLLPYMALAKERGESVFLVRNLSNHAKTNMWLIKHFLDVEFEIQRINSITKVIVKDSHGSTGIRTPVSGSEGR
ncbi:MAG: RNA 3'-terminal phosphate cyclase [Thermoplasmata archaeon]|nr:RNA 3'-terminal phosphate cyclase [Thermoplasmata archaeon]